MKLLKAMKTAAMVTVMIYVVMATIFILSTSIISPEAGFVLLIFMVIFGSLTVLSYNREI